MGKKMGGSFSNISRWLWTGKNKQEPAPNKSSPPPGEGARLCANKPGSVKVSSADSPLMKGNGMKLNGRHDMIIDREYDAVLVPSAEDRLSESETGELDWSIGWLESFSTEFQSDDESDGSYAVLVPCYKHGSVEGRDGPNTTLGNLITGASFDYSAEGRKYMEQWLSSLRGR